ncbi:TRAP transporter small permease [Marispirochaeta sp.]|jgi:TRAP-type transport system small permease protein|uniref:TRAP transporter small permease n=1 Tax=Marispirochaeta sp. TaxID=2038653 RepID=UPI0029C93BBA|nr:TRAP transporter small permease [Marispirochaeta sp.]
MKIQTFCEASARIVNMATALLIAALTLFVSWQVFARYVLNAGQFWAEELSIIVMIWIGILGASSTLWSESHIGLNVFVDRLPETGKVMARVFSDFLIAGFGIYLFIYGLQLVNKITGTWSALRISIGMTYIVVPVSAVLLVLFAISKGVLRLAAHFSASQNTSSN